jgi:hypothetical protein
MGPRVGQINSPAYAGPQIKEDVIAGKKGETLQQIAKRTGVPYSDLKDANPDIDPKKPLSQNRDVRYPKELLVQPGEKTLEQVAKRLEIVDIDGFKKANAGHIKDPDNLRQGQAVRLPKDFEDDKARGTRIKEKRITKDGVKLPGGAGTITGGKGGVVYRPPTVKIGGVTIPLPDVVLTDGKGIGVSKTPGTYDGTGEANKTRRSEEEKNISNTRQKDERDIDPRNDKKKPKLETEKRPRSSESYEEKHQIKKSAQDPQQLDQELQKRLAEEAADFARKGGR